MYKRPQQRLGTSSHFAPAHGLATLDACGFRCATCDDGCWQEGVPNDCMFNRLPVRRSCSRQLHVPMSDTHNSIARSSPVAPITAGGIACFLLQLVLNVSLLSVTFLACVVWCVPSSLLLGVVASVEATLGHTRTKRARARMQQSATTVQSTAAAAIPCGQVSYATQIYGLGAAAA